MYDNILIKIDAHTLGKENLFIELSNLPFETTIESKDGVIQKLKFKVDNLIVEVKEKEIVIKGSICKYYHGTNQYTLTRIATEKAFDKLSKALKLPIQNFSVMLFEAASNIIVDNEVEFYFRLLGPLQGYKTSPFINGTLYYENSYRKLTFYDKTRQTDAYGINRIPEFINQNVLRYEIKFQKSVALKFFRKNLLVKDLFDKDFYKEVVKYWSDEYFKIYKYQKLSFDTSIFKDIRNLEKQLMILGLNSLGGEHVVLEMLEQEKNKGTFKNTGKDRRLIYKLKELCSKSSLVKTCEGIIELNNKIKQEAEMQLQE
ncbi:hypothetical protein AL1_10570 [Sporocytophaga myxococcoides]|uniref:Replication-associated protein G2P N-terminal domain-containing protein n=1 Tax=Sporocytophaga myxococcoides TaxID=153721 RepID=A0A098LIK8_9BACT|nr:phage/plasmid replication protein [Sporocytophaga myxococcoides]GAL86821.1 hypothetical protein AL1_10570 [Sporocytophaga myxococcoides]